MLYLETLREAGFFIALIIYQFMKKAKTLTKERKMEIALIMKKLKDIQDFEIAEMAGVTRQTLDNRIRKGERV